MFTEWLVDVPELNDRRRAKAWLTEVWNREDHCSDSFRSSSFAELELGRLLLRDDGWLDRGELAWLREHTRRRD